jgi:hypothetical protein
MTYRLLAIAEEELAAAATWYETEAIGLGGEFLDEFEAAMKRIIQSPNAWKRVSVRHRRCLFRRFPYGILYSLSATEIRVSGVIDLRRDPQRSELRTKET